ncbi:helix-turn-helix domain-containing protein [Microbacterium sp. KSW4-11]|uniref:Helix-turn-helix domain-containing protein n=1 Tax=Microbacterium gawkjiense TaxID=3067309 RepID=A0ABU3GCS8_9MICO|nr:helix-turn-helix domain-containing protein [Microbacterium sp. KSW4-11]MDT3317619.1 helix-turn-helix domain-containing protein [Microbacterium sp. KSW4-11]
MDTADAADAADAQDWATLALRRTPTQQRSRRKVTQAIAAAEALVLTEGVDVITLPRVAAEAGVSVGALYQYLPDREAILGAIVARYHERLERLLDEAIERMRTDPRTEDPVGRVLRAVADVYLDEGSARSLGTVAISAEADAARRRHKRAMADRVHTLLRLAGVLDRVDAERGAAVARVAFASADAVLHEAFAASEAERALLLAELERSLRASLGA